MMSIRSLFRRSRYAYDRLSSGRDDVQDSPTIEDRRESREEPSDSSAVFYLTLLCIACTLLNLLILRVEEYRTAQQAHPTNLRRPTQFIGLDRVERPFPPEDRSIANFPFIVGLVDQTRPTTAIPNVRRGLKTDAEISAPEARQIKITKSISTVVQFRTLDWGMEACVLTLRMPSDESAVQSNSSLTLGSDLNDVDIHRLIEKEGQSSFTTVINQPKLSYKTLPTFGKKLGTVSIDYGAEWTHTFPCAEDSLHSFALVAADDSTQVEWWQDKQSLEPAFFISQHASR